MSILNNFTNITCFDKLLKYVLTMYICTYVYISAYLYFHTTTNHLYYIHSSESNFDIVTYLCVVLLLFFMSDQS